MNDEILTAISENEERNIYTVDNKVFFVGSIYSKSITELKMAILNINKTKPDNIELYIYSSGGSIYSGFSMVDFIERNPFDIHTIVDGLAFSAGATIALAGKKRMITKNSYMLIHELKSNNGWSKYSNTIDNFNHETEMMKRLETYYIKKSKMDKARVKEMLKGENYLTAEQALSFGMVDEIL